MQLATLYRPLSLGYSLQANRKTLEGRQHPDRDAQFNHINRQVKAFQRQRQPVVSVDTKKKELVGPFKNACREWRPRGDPERVRVHDFPDSALGKAIPYGVYDLTRDAGWVSVGVDHDTAAFAVETLRRWWWRMGCVSYPAARRLLITADGGGSNGSRNRLWKWELQKLSDETGLRISVCHFPPGTSKWNKIEHRMFCHITENWRGRPLVSLEVVVNLIGHTTTRSGLAIRSELDANNYPTGQPVTAQQMESVSLNSLWQKSIDRSRPESTEWRRLGGMAMGKKPAARQPSPMWVTTADLPTSAGHPFFERLNRVLEEAGFDAFVEGLCAVFYASRLGRPSLRPGRYFRLLFIGYFEGLSSERGIAWRVADSLSLRAFLDLDVTEAPPNHSTLSRTRRLIDVETHVAVFTWVLERLAGAGLVQGKTVGVDATTLEANAAMRSIERRDTGESYEAFVRQLAKASGIETPTRAELARFDRSRKDRKTSNKEWQSPQDTDAKIAKMKDGRTHLAHKAEHGIDLETGAILSVTVQEASEGDSATLPATLTMAAEQVEAVQPAGAEVEEVVADKGYHSDATLVALDEIGVRSYVSEPERGRRCWQDKKTGETPAEKRAAQKALYGNRRRIRGDRGRRLQRRRGELVERPFAHQYETGGLRRVWVRGHENVRKRVLIQAAGCNLGQLLRRLTGVGTPRSLQGRALSAICGLIGRLTALWGRLTASWDFQWTPAGLVGSIAHRQAA